MFERIMRKFELVKASWVDPDGGQNPRIPDHVRYRYLACDRNLCCAAEISDGEYSLATNSVTGMILLFLFYLVSYFVVIFFNVGPDQLVYMQN